MRPIPINAAEMRSFAPLMLPLRMVVASVAPADWRNRLRSAVKSFMLRILSPVAGAHEAKTAEIFHENEGREFSSKIFSIILDNKVRKSYSQINTDSIPGDESPPVANPLSARPRVPSRGLFKFLARKSSQDFQHNWTNGSATIIIGLRQHPWRRVPSRRQPSECKALETQPGPFSLTRVCVPRWPAALRRSLFPEPLLL